MATLRDLDATLKNVGKQMRFAQSQALTKVAREMEAAEKAHLEETFDNITPFTRNSVRSRGARSNNLEARVFIQSIAAGYLEPFEFGGVHKLSGRALLNPKQIRLNKYGNLPRTRTKTDLSLKKHPPSFII